jgi:hypothetical protein
LDFARLDQKPAGPKMLRKIIEAEIEAGITPKPPPVLARENGETLANSPISPTSGKEASDRFQRLEKLLQEAFQELERLKKVEKPT